MFTDKLVAKIPSTAAGKITAINFSADDIAPVGHTILQIETDSSQAAAVEPAKAEVGAAVPDHSASADVHTDKVAEAGPGK